MESYIAGRALPAGHISVTDKLEDFLPPNHPLNLDEMLQNPFDYELPFGHPNLNEMMNITELDMPEIPVYFDHPDVIKSFTAGRALPPGHVSVTDLFEDYLPFDHPLNLDEMLQNPSEYELPLGHPDFADMMDVRHLETPSVTVYFDHPNATKSFIAGRALPSGHVSVTEMFEDYLPPDHPLNLDEMMQNPADYELPLGHPDFSRMMKVEELDLPMIAVYFDHPNATESFIGGRPLPPGHVSVTDMLEEFLPPGHPLNLDEMMQNPFKYQLPLGHPDFANMMDFKTLKEISIPVYFHHPNATESFVTGRALPPGHVSVSDRLEDFLPPNHPWNLDEMLQNPSDYKLPLGHPNFSSMMKEENLRLPKISVYFHHPNATESFISGRALPPGHMSVTDMLDDFLPPNHPLNLDEMLKNPSEYELPLGHPDLAKMMREKDLPETGIELFFPHPDVTESIQARRALPVGHPNVAELLEEYLPRDHPLNLDEMLNKPSQFPLPFGHPDLSSFMKVERIPPLIFTAHPNIDANLRAIGGFDFPKSHPSVIDLLEDFLPPGHPPDLDNMLRNPSSFELPGFHPSLQFLMNHQSTISAMSTSTAIVADVSLSVFSGHPYLGTNYDTRIPIEHHPTIHYLFENALPDHHPNIDELMTTGFSLPSWHPELDLVITQRTLSTSPAAILSYTCAILFAVVLITRNARHWSNLRKSSELVVDDHASSSHDRISVDTTMKTHHDVDDSAKEIHVSISVDNSLSDEGDEIECVGSNEAPLPRLNHMHHNAMKLHKHHNDDNLEPAREPVRSSIIAYQEKKNSRMRSAYTFIYGRRVPLTHFSSGEVLWCSLYIVANVIALLTSPTYNLDVGFGSLAAGNILFLIISAAKNSIFMTLRIAFDQMLLYHRFLSHVTVATAIIHSCFYLDRLLAFMSDSIYKTGFGALLCGIFIFVTSISYVRRRFFNVFFWSHFAYIGFIVAVYLHARGARPFILTAVTFYGLDKLVQLLSNRSRRTTLIKKVGSRTAKVRFEKPFLVALRKHNPGQYVFVNFPELSRTEWHPYSIASGDEPFIDLYIRALGDHTEKVVKHAEECNAHGKQALIRCDGPYGNLSFNYYRYGSLVLVGGGIGITPIISVLKNIYECDKRQRANKRICIRNVHLIWIMPHASEADLFLDLLMCYRSLATRNPALPHLEIMIHVTRDVPAAEHDKIPILFSRPDFFSVMEKCIGDRHEESTSILVYACGPGKMVNQLWDASMKRNKKDLRVDFYHESFEF